jgi:agmatine deiminase
VVASRNKVILADKIFRENPQYTRHALRQALEELLQVEHCIFIPQETGDLFGHSDGIVRFLDEDTVLINDYAAVNKAYGKRLKAVLQEHRLHYEELPYFVEGRSTDGIPSAVGSYINYLQVDGLIVVPSFGVPRDEPVLKKLEALFPTAKLFRLRCEQLAREGGILRCASWGFKARRKSRPALTQPLADACAYNAAPVLGRSRRRRPREKTQG